MAGIHEQRRVPRTEPRRQGVVLHRRDRKLMAVEVKGGGNKLEADIPKALFDVRVGGLADGFDVSTDGRSLIPTATEESANPPLTVVANGPGGAEEIALKPLVRLIRRFM